MPKKLSFTPFEFRIYKQTREILSGVVRDSAFNYDVDVIEDIFKEIHTQTNIADKEFLVRNLFSDERDEEQNLIVNPLVRALQLESYDVIAEMFRQLKTCEEKFQSDEFSNFLDKILFYNVFHSFVFREANRIPLEKILESEVGQTAEFKEYFAKFLQKHPQSELSAEVVEILRRHEIIRPVEFTFLTDSALGQTGPETAAASTETPSTKSSIESDQEEGSQQEKGKGHQSRKKSKKPQKEKEPREKEELPPRVELFTSRETYDLPKRKEKEPKNTTGDKAKELPQIATIEIESFDELQERFYNQFIHHISINYYRTASDEEKEAENAAAKDSLCAITNLLYGEAQLQEKNYLSSDLIHFAFNDFYKVVDFCNFTKVGDSADINIKIYAENENRIITEIFYFILTNQAIPLWLQEKIKAVENGEEGLKTHFQNLAMKMIYENLPKERYQTLSVTPTLQELLDKGASFEEIRIFVSQTKSTKALRISSLSGILTHPQAGDILTCLTNENPAIIIYERDQAIIHQAFKDAVTIGAFDFTKCHKDWFENWLASKEVTEVLKKPAGTETNEEAIFVTNLLRSLNIKQLRKIDFSKGTLVSSQRIIAQYFESHFLSKHSDELIAEYKKVLTLLNEKLDEETITTPLLTFLRVASVANPVLFTKLVAATHAAVKIQPKFLHNIFTAFGAVFLDYTSRNDEKGFFNALREWQRQYQNEIPTILSENLASFSQNEFKPFKIYELISANFADKFKDFYYEFVKTLNHSNRGRLFLTDEQVEMTMPQSEDEEQPVTYCEHNFFYDAAIATKFDVEFLKEIFADAEQSLKPRAFYIMLAITKNGQQDNLINFIVNNLSEEDDKKYFRDFFIRIKKAMIEQNENELKEEEQKKLKDEKYKAAVNEFSKPYLLLLNQIIADNIHLVRTVESTDGLSAEQRAALIAEYSSTNLISRMVDHFNERSRALFVEDEFKFIHFCEAQEIIWKISQYDFDREEDLEKFRKDRRSLHRAKKEGKVTIEEELASKLLIFAARGVPVPIWLHRQIKLLGKGSLDAGIVRITAVIKNPKIKAILNNVERADFPPLSYINTNIDAYSTPLNQLVLCGADLKDFAEHFTNKQLKPSQVNFDALLLNPQASDIIQLICRNSSFNNFSFVFARAIEKVDEEFLCKAENAAQLRIMLGNHAELMQRTGSKILPDCLPASTNFSQERVLMNFYAELFKLKEFAFATPKGLLEHMKKAAELYPDEFIDYLKEVKEKIPKENFRTLLSQDLKGEGVIDLVRKKSPQDYDKLRDIYVETYGKEVVDKLFKKFVTNHPNPSIEEAHGLRVTPKKVQEYHGA